MRKLLLSGIAALLMAYAHVLDSEVAEAMERVAAAASRHG